MLSWHGQEKVVVQPMLDCIAFFTMFPLDLFTFVKDRLFAGEHILNEEMCQGTVFLDMRGYDMNTPQNCVLQHNHTEVGPRVEPPHDDEEGVGLLPKDTVRL